MDPPTLFSGNDFLFTHNFYFIADVTIFSGLSLQTNLYIFLTIFVNECQVWIHCKCYTIVPLVILIKREMFSALALCGRYGCFFIDIEKVVFEIRLHNANIETRLKSSWIGFRVYFMEEIFFIVLNCKKKKQIKEIQNSFLLLERKRPGEVKDGQLLDVLIQYTLVKAQLLACIFYISPVSLKN